ncbi:hypothetical protein BA6E_124380 [Bacteroidales bacterium 6E]|nr:hypothetical protein BA6E_124380 [Bacteroidales bacterium 6E]
MPNCLSVILIIPTWPYSGSIGYFGDTDPRFGDIDPLNRLRLKEHDRLTILPFFS